MTAAPGAKRPAVFIDRDGTINVEKEYLHQPEDFEFIPGVPEALRLLATAGYLIVVVTNQSGVARGFYSEEDVRRLHDHMDALLEREGAMVNAYYYCPHHPDSGFDKYRRDCDCRKPHPGMLLQAAEELKIDLAASWMIGDKRADVEAGKAAGCRSVLVLTGYGLAERRTVSPDVPVFDTLLATAREIVRLEGEHFSS